MATSQACLTNGLITPSEHSELVEAYDHVGRMLTRWINYLQESDWTDRGQRPFGRKGPHGKNGQPPTSQLPPLREIEAAHRAPQ
jgi:hypothetical protein